MWIEDPSVMARRIQMQSVFCEVPSPLGSSWPGRDCYLFSVIVLALSYFEMKLFGTLEITE